MPDPGRVGDEPPRLGILQPLAGQPRVDRVRLRHHRAHVVRDHHGEHTAEERPGILTPGDDLLQRHRERQVHEHEPGKAGGEHQRVQLAAPALTGRDQPQVAEIDLQLTARRPVIDRRGHLLPASSAPPGREPVQRPLRHHHALPGQQDPDLDHRHPGLDPRGDLLAAGLQLRPALAMPVRPDRADHRHDLPDQLIGELILPAPTRQASRHRGRHIPFARLAVNTGLRGHRPLALPREPGPQRLTNLDHRHLPVHHPGDLQSLDWRRSNRDDAGQAAHHAAGPATGDRVVPCSWRKTPQPGPMTLADDIPVRPEGSPSRGGRVSLLPRVPGPAAPWRDQRR